MAANLRPFVRIGAVLFLALALLVAGLPGAVKAQPSSDTIIYVVQPGDRLVDIAARYGVSASAIVRANNLANSDVIYPGQQLVIPAAGAAPPPSPTPPPTSVPTPAPTLQPAATSAPLPSTPGVNPPESSEGSVITRTYEVQAGDTLAGIARRFGLSAAALLQANGITNPDLIRVGQKLVVPQAGSAGGSPAQPTAQPEAQNTPLPAATTATLNTPAPTPAEITPAKIHVVQAGETLSQIAKKYGVSVAAIVEANGLGTADLIGVGVRLLIPGQGGASTDKAGALPAKPTKFVASISQQRCWVYSGQTVIARWVCSTGRRGSATRPGTYKIQSKLPKAYGSTWNIWMPFWLGIYWAGGSENGIHGLPWDAKTGVQIWSGNVGKPITFGCIMLDNVNAKLLYDMAWIGMPVIVQP